MFLGLRLNKLSTSSGKPERPASMPDFDSAFYDCYTDNPLTNELPGAAVFDGQGGVRVTRPSSGDAFFALKQPIDVKRGHIYRLSFLLTELTGGSLNINQTQQPPVSSQDALSTNVLGPFNYEFVAEGDTYRGFCLWCSLNQSFSVEDILIVDEGIPNLYVNGDFESAGPNSPPFNHQVLFETADWEVQEVAGGPNLFLSNTTELLGRAPLAYSLQANNPNLIVGNDYRIEYQIENRSATNYTACLTVTSDVDVTIIRQKRNCSANSTTTVFVEFTVNAPTYEVLVRVGSGTTAPNTAYIVVSKGRMYDLTAIA